MKIYRGVGKDFIEEVGRIKTIFDLIVKRLERPLYVANILDAGLGSYKGSTRPFIAMDYYPMNMETLIYGGKTTTKEIMKIMLKIARTLAYTSSIGIHHGDLKPGNILIREIDRRLYPAIADWGGGFTPGYAAPEVYASGGGQISEKSDIYSFGIL